MAADKASGTRPDAFQLDGLDLAARHRGEQPGAQRGQDVAAAAQRFTSRTGQRDRLQQRHHRHQVVRAHLRHRQVGGAVRPDDKGELGEELGHVQADLQVAGFYIAVARVEQHGLAVVGEQDAIRGQAPVRDLVGVQPADRIPDLAELGVAAAGIPLGQRRPLVVIVGQHGGFGTGPDQGAQPRRGRAGVLGRVGQQGPALDRVLHGQRGVAGHLPAHPHPPVQPVDGAGRLLVPVVHDDVQPAAVSVGCDRVVARWVSLAGFLAADPPYRGHRQADGGQRARDVQGARPLRRGARGVPDGEADRAAADHRDQQGQHGGVQRSHVHDRVHGDRRPQGVPPVRQADQADHGGVGDQARQVRIERRGVARARTGHDDRVVEPAGGGPREQVVDHRRQDNGQDAGGRRLGEPPELAPDEQLDGHGHRQDEQGEQRQRSDHDEQRMRQPAARAHDVGLHAGRGGAGRDAGHRQRDDPDAGQDAAQQVDRLADAALELILDLDLAWLRGRHGTIVSPGRLAA